ncbi:hypothetical protein H9L10_14250 [Phycicoccus endophyticus]|uniref:Uncharacterized protein n=1 Tax=Phycicoccus endophyticus TaxID=1690220 RepID=A0A7G9R171_9MICO|nr:hypothetical protein H9L10_14250 [Phycicoccus endophyticus]
MAQSRGVAHRYELHTGVPLASTSHTAEDSPSGAKSLRRGKSRSGTSACASSHEQTMFVEPLEYCW